MSCIDHINVPEYSQNLNSADVHSRTIQGAA